MRKFIACTFTIVLVVMLVFALSGGNEAVPDSLINVTEASFDSPASINGTNASSFLIGSFRDREGNVLAFDGHGRFTQTLSDGSSEKGSYTLVQKDDGNAIFRLAYADYTKIFSFALSAPDGSFTITAIDGAVSTYSPFIS